MKSKDLKTVLRGVQLVAQQLVLNEGPTAAARVNQVAAHVRDLGRLAPHLFDERFARAADAAAAASHRGPQHPVPHSDAEAHGSQATPKEPPHHPQPVGAHKAHPKAHKPRKPAPPPRPRKPVIPDFDDVDAAVVDNHGSFRERKVPAGPMSRVFGFSQLAAGMVVGTAGEVLRRATGLSHSPPASSYVMTDGNAERLADALCKMRGAALKVGQMLSIQDDTMLPPVWRKVLKRVRQEANIMPAKQLHHVLETELGSDWRSNFTEFHDVPIAAASIGQVHHAVLPSGQHVAVKVQYPGVADSIDSDLDNLERLIAVADVFPKGFYIDNIIQVAREELKMECDYTLEARNQQQYRDYVTGDPLVRDAFRVPRVEMELCTPNVLVSQLIPGAAIDTAADLSQEQRDIIGRRLLQLTIQELFVYRFMQTDPNWGNFLYDERRDLIGLLDFGAARHYRKEFVDDYLRLVWAAANDDRDTFAKVSLDMGLLTGHESQMMLEAHVEAGLVVGQPFASDDPFDFQELTSMTRRVQKHAEVFAEHRLTPPPKEIYSLHRRLSGAFFMCIHLGSKFQARDVLETTFENHVWGPETEEVKEQ